MQLLVLEAAGPEQLERHAISNQKRKHLPDSVSTLIKLRQS